MLTMSLLKHKFVIYNSADYKNGIIGLTDDNGHDVLYDVFENNPNLKKNHVMTESANAVQETAVSESRKPI